LLYSVASEPELGSGIWIGDFAIWEILPSNVVEPELMCLANNELGFVRGIDEPECWSCGGSSQLNYSIRITMVTRIQMKALARTFRRGLHLLGSRRCRGKVALFLVDSVKELGSGNTCNFEFCKSCFEGINTDEHAVR
jgi:hypothetical protein